MTFTTPILLLPKLSIHHDIFSHRIPMEPNEDNNLAPNTATDMLEGLHEMYDLVCSVRAGSKAHATRWQT